jgi:hypothetical protein
MEKVIVRFLLKRSNYMFECLRHKVVPYTLLPLMCAVFSGCGGSNDAATPTVAFQTSDVVKHSVPINGECGSPQGTYVTVEPSGTHCALGIATAPLKGSDGAWTWVCQGQNGGSQQACNTVTVMPVPGV